MGLAAKWLHKRLNINRRIRQGMKRPGRHTRTRSWLGDANPEVLHPNNNRILTALKIALQLSAMSIDAFTP
jgi:hypothetical protein